MKKYIYTLLFSITASLCWAQIDEARMTRDLDIASTVLNSLLETKGVMYWNDVNGKSPQALSTIRWPSPRRSTALQRPTGRQAQIIRPPSSLFHSFSHPDRQTGPERCKRRHYQIKSQNHPIPSTTTNTGPHPWHHPRSVKLFFVSILLFFYFIVAPATLFPTRVRFSFLGSFGVWTP